MLKTKEEELKKEIEQVEERILEISKSHFPKYDRKKHRAYLMSENFHHYLELKAELKGRQEQKEEDNKKFQDALKKLEDKINGLFKGCDDLTGFNAMILLEIKELKNQLNEKTV